MIKQIALQDVQSCNFKPELYTVALVDDGVWYGYISIRYFKYGTQWRMKKGGKYGSPKS